MEIEYWIISDGEWKKVSADEYYRFEGTKDIFPKGRGPGWDILVSILCGYGERELI